jgi:hypothetical protein
VSGEAGGTAGPRRAPRALRSGSFLAGGLIVAVLLVAALAVPMVLLYRPAPPVTTQQPFGQQSPQYGQPPVTTQQPFVQQPAQTQQYGQPQQPAFGQPRWPQ